MPTTHKEQQHNPVAVNDHESRLEANSLSELWPSIMQSTSDLKCNNSFTKEQKQYLRDFICNKLMIISYWAKELESNDEVLAKKVEKNVDQISQFLSQLNLEEEE